MSVGGVPSPSGPTSAQPLLIIRRYLIREILQSFAAVLAVLLLVYLSDRFVRYLAEAVAGKISAEIIIELLALNLVSKIAILLPLALFLGVLLGLGRMYKDSEVVAMWAGGFGVRGVVETVLWLSLAVGILTGFLSLYVSPRLATVQENIVNRARGEADVMGISPGQFKLFGRGNVLYVGSIADNGKTMEDVFVRVGRGDREELLLAERAYNSVPGREGDRFIVLEEGYRYSGQAGELDFVVTRFERHAVRLDAITKPHDRHTRESVRSSALWGSADLRDTAELQWRLSLPISLVVLGVLAVPMSRTRPSQGRYARLFLGIVVYFIYSNGIGVAQNLVGRGDVTPVVGVWAVHGLMGVVVAGLVFTQTSAWWWIGRHLGRARRPG